MKTSGEVTRILGRLADGDRGDLDRLLAIVYDELRVVAAASFRRERPDHTLQPTVLVHDAFLRLVDQKQISWRSRSHFYAAASGVIRRILVDHARARGSVKRGGRGKRRVTLTTVDVADSGDAVDVLALEDALEQLGTIDERQARIVELRVFGGLTIDAIADVLEVGKRTVDRDWRCARLWLYHEMHGLEEGDGEPPV